MQNRAGVLNSSEVKRMSEKEWERLLTLMEFDFKQLLERASKAKALEEENNFLRECITRLESGTNSVLQTFGGNRT